MRDGAERWRELLALVGPADLQVRRRLRQVCEVLLAPADRLLEQPVARQRDLRPLRELVARSDLGSQLAGRVLQLITGSTGIDDFEWGVTLFAVRPDDLKDVVYTMRFDEVSAQYAEFGPFYTGLIGDPEEVLEQLAQP